MCILNYSGSGSETLDMNDLVRRETEERETIRQNWEKWEKGRVREIKLVHRIRECVCVCLRERRRKEEEKKQVYL